MTNFTGTFISCFLLNRTDVGTEYQFHKILLVTKCGITYLFIFKTKKEIVSFYFSYLLSERKIHYLMIHYLMTLK